jgi:septum site-determining protein MinC
MKSPAHAVREPACEIRFGQVGVAQLRVRSTVPSELAAELERKIAQAPHLFARAAICLDLNALPALPDASEALVIFDTIRAAGMLPIALAYGTPEVETLARLLDVPVLAKFRAQYEAIGAAPAVPPPDAVAPSAPAAAPEPVAVAARPAVSQIHAQPVRSGQQIYAKQRDLVLTATVGAGAEVIADGSIHVYGTLRGRALAGALGDATARIFCSDFQAELVAIAGRYRVLEEVPAELRGRPVQARLDGEQLVLEPLR